MSMFRRSWITAGADWRRRFVVAARTLSAVLSMVAAAPTLAAESATKDYDIIVFSRPVAGKEAEFNTWYDHQHVPDLLKVPNFQTGRRFVTIKAATPSSNLPPYVVIYGVHTADLAATNDEVRRRAASGVIIHGEALDYDSLVTAIFTPLGPRLQAKQLSGTSVAMKAPGKTRLQTFYLIVFSNPVTNREDEYNGWYNAQQLPDMLHVPGFVWGQRYILAQNDTPAVSIPRYLVTYELQSYDLDATIAEIKRRTEAGLTRTSTSMAADAMMYYLSPLGPTVKAKHQGT